MERGTGIRYTQLKGRAKPVLSVAEGGSPFAVTHPPRLNPGAGALQTFL